MTAPHRPRLELLDEAVAPHILRAMRAASEQLARLGVRHALVGGLAIGAWGYPRATKDVDFLVGEEAFEHHLGGLVTMKPGVPIQVAGVAIDFLSPKPDDPHIGRALGISQATSVPVAPLDVVIALKLESPRQKDFADVVELVKAGIDVSGVEAVLTAEAPTLLPKWQRAVASARAEEVEE